MHPDTTRLLMYTPSSPCREGGSAEAMTVRRMGLVSNGPLAAAAVRAGLHGALRAGSSSLVAVVRKFAAEYTVGGLSGSGR